MTLQLVHELRFDLPPEAVRTRQRKAADDECHPANWCDMRLEIALKADDEFKSIGTATGNEPTAFAAE